jgi:hypothetical protein
MTRRNALRTTADPHSLESIISVVERYGEIEEETYNEIVLWLAQHQDEYSFECEYEEIGIGKSIPIIKVQRKGSCIIKILDNQHDAENTLANIRNKYFPNNKQGE